MLVLSVLLPSVVKLTHAFNHHTHEVCDSDNELKTHFHESDLDCDFYKFKLTNNLFLVFNNYEIITEKTATKQLSSHYSSFNNYQYSKRYVRGPPMVS
ncbi:hypothetical protein SAMN04489796_103186 [Winogradskyella thalassocola]|uniref:Uncharacterized protein n=2 Tax=Winogradskyella thalassocola TaxID=262004 RepID=A0A1G8DDV4_9FLAO|nr:hypothetical protein SAMN04489796_103186 [Winogradskyella thalassocola]